MTNKAVCDKALRAVIDFRDRSMYFDIRPQMPWRVAQVEALPDYQLRVCFMDGLEGIVNIAPLVQSNTAGVFTALSNKTLFQQVFLEYGVVTWPGELDLAPDTMYNAIKNSGEWRVA